MSNKGLLVVIIVLLLGIFTLAALEVSERSPGERVADDIGEFTEELSDEVDDATTN